MEIKFNKENLYNVMHEISTDEQLAKGFIKGYEDLTRSNNQKNEILDKYISNILNSINDLNNLVYFLSELKACCSNEENKINKAVVHEEIKRIS